MPTGEKYKYWRQVNCIEGHQKPDRSKGSCAECRKERYRARYRRNPGKRMESAADWARRNPEAARDCGRAQRLGVPVAEVRRVIAECNGACQACGVELSHSEMRIDHDHATGRIRGVLCHFCNVLEGMLHKKADRITQLRAYLYRCAKKVVEEESPFPETETDT